MGGRDADLNPNLFDKLAERGRRKRAYDKNKNIWVECPDGRRRLVNVYSATRSGMAELLEIRNLDKQIKSLQNQVKKDKGRDADLNQNLFDKLAERGRRKRAYDKNKN